MKRIVNKGRYVRLQWRRGEHALERRRCRAKYLKAKRRTHLGKPKRLRRYETPTRVLPRAGFTRVQAPPDMRMVHNPEGCNAFFATLAHHLERRNPVRVSIYGVRRVDSAAIVILLAIMIRFRAQGVGFGGDFPKDQAIREAIAKSGFFQGLYRKYEDRDTYSVSPERGLHTHAEKKVNSVLTARIISNAATTVWGEPRRAQGVQRILLELMHNTNNHAALEGQGEKHWWLSVNHQKKKHKVTFTFVDFGVGVFTSLDSKGKTSKWFGWRDQLITVLKRMDNPMIMKAILDGRLHETVTKQSFRGKGLPGIRQVQSRNGVSNLLIVTNDVYAHVGRGEYSSLKVPFSGTLVIWELQPSNSCTPAHEDD
ncbi:MAG TPA: STAS domain-containing protein [Longimicrobiaceae bacterium]|nr:STAS domain-containing protein [Longimicrobiaceae bacterium]